MIPFAPGERIPETCSPPTSAELRRAKHNAAKTRRRRQHRIPKDQRKQDRGIIAIDGEGESDACEQCGTREDCEHEPDSPRLHRYTELQAVSENGDKWGISNHSLSTERCLDFLLALPTDQLAVIYSGGYDANMWLSDVPLVKPTKPDTVERILADVPKRAEYCNGHDCLNDLRNGNHIFYRHYRIEYIPRKMFRVSDIRTRVRKENRKSHTTRKYTKTVTVYDVFGYFQCSFVAALKEHKIGTPDEVRLIEDMKALRGSFEASQSDRIQEYCYLECELLVRMMRKLIGSIEETGVSPKQWMGAGSLAAAFLAKYNITDYLTDIPDEYLNEVRGCYYGGRFEVQATGAYGDVWLYDINSAYPHIIRQLPCLCSLEWGRTADYDSAALAVWRVRWNIPGESVWGPFPFRAYGRIFYPVSGEGWYHASEVQTARAIWGERIEVLEGITFTPRCNHRPFDWVAELYQQRKEWKKQGNYAQYTLKLAINSLYGKLAQRCGWHGQKPTYQNYLWAGMVTAGTRAMLYEAASKNFSAVVLMATDGIVSTAPLDLNTGDNLGEWETGQAACAFVFGNGIYLQGRTREAMRAFLTASTQHDRATMNELQRTKQVNARSRGFSPYDVDWQQIITLWSRNPYYGKYHYRFRQFRGYGSAIMLSEEHRYQWRRWVLVERDMNFQLRNRYLHPDDYRPVREQRRMVRVRYLPFPITAPIFRGVTESMPFDAEGWAAKAPELQQHYATRRAEQDEQPA